MKTRKTRTSSVASLSIVALLLSLILCGVANASDSSEAQHDFDINAQTVSERYFPFVYSTDDGFAWVREYIGNCTNCTPGYLYVKDMETGEVYQLISAPVSQFCTHGEFLYGIVSEQEIVLADYTGSQKETIYVAKYGELSHIQMYENFLFFADGNFVIRLSLFDMSCTTLASCEGITFLCPVSESEFAWMKEDDTRARLVDVEKSSTVFVEFDDLFYGENSEYSVETADEVQPFLLSDAQEDFPLSEYPVGSYFTTTGVACPSHDEDESGNSQCNSIEYHSSTQCMGFAKYACDQYAHRSSFSYTESHTISRKRELVSAAALYEMLSELGKGAYIRLQKADGKEHSVVLVRVTTGSVVVYEANYSGLCKVGTRTVTLDQFILQYKYIVKTFAHSFDGIPMLNNDTYHTIPCSYSDCAGYILETHMAETPGENAVCVECGYVGQILVGVSSVSDANQ